MMSPRIKTVVQVATIGAGVVGVVVVTNKAVKSVRRQIGGIFPTTDDLLGCSNEQPFVSSRQQEEDQMVSK